MVDYTDPLMRDESYRRWKGGAALAEELRKFYTSPAALQRIARNNAMGPALPAAAEKLRKLGMRARPKQWNSRNKTDSGNDTLAQARGRIGRKQMLQQMLNRRSVEQERSPSSQSGAFLP